MSRRLCKMWDKYSLVRQIYLGGQATFFKGGLRGHRGSAPSLKVSQSLFKCLSNSLQKSPKHLSIRQRYGISAQEAFDVLEELGGVDLAGLIEILAVEVEDNLAVRI